MSTFKDALCLLAIFFAYGITGHMDYEDAVLLEETQRTLQPSASPDCWPATPSPTGNPVAQVRHLGSDPQSDKPSAPTSDPRPEAIQPCPPVVY